ncbi:MAG: DUF559 domain-containing protein [Galactobacter sp.]
MDILEILWQLGGVTTGVALQRRGFPRWRLSQLVASGTIHRIRPGVYAHPNLDPRTRTAALHGGMLTCVSALRLMRVWVLPREEHLHVWMGAKGNPHHHADCRCLLHWSPGRAGLGRVNIELALLHLRKCAGDMAFFASFESAWATKRLNTPARNRIRAGLPVGKRWLVDFAVGNSGSGLESILRYRLRQVGLSVAVQVSVNTVGRVDFIIGGRLILEVDGYEYHSDRDTFIQDRRRQAAASILGLETLNFSYQQVLNEWTTVLASIRAAMQRARDVA